jgi:two-component system, cell cycle sensor histidine kinase and response regulator CckA
VGHGTGLGLATVYGIVTQNSGYIDVYSEKPGGTTFRIYLPKAAESDEVAADTRAPVTERPNGVETLLLVEDEKCLRVTAQIFLKELGYRVLSAKDPKEAFALVEEHAGEIHMLITDVVMPGMSGRDLACRMGRSWPEMKCLFMSGYPADVIADRGILDQDINFLGKPFSRDDLAHKVRAVLDAE